MRPQSEEDLSEIIRAATGPLCIAGGGTRGVAIPGADVLSTSGLSGLVLHEPAALTLIARAGTPLTEIDAALTAHRQRLAFEPADWRGLLGCGTAPTIGGVVAANIAGPRRAQAGAARDACLGVRFVDGNGTLIRNGGRVMKNVTGYDLVKLMAGSWGTLGVLTEVALKVLPAPEAEATLAIAGRDLAAAVAVMTRALNSPYEVTGAARLPDGRVLIRVEGFAQSVAYRAERLGAMLAPFGPATVLAAAESADAWRAVRDVAVFHGRAGDVWRFGQQPSAAAAIAARLGGEVLMDWGGGLVWALVPEGTNARALAAPYVGHATLVRASAATREHLPRFQPERPEVAALAAGLRARFDPRGVLNPRLMG